MKRDVVRHLAESLGLAGEEIPAFYASFMDSFSDCAGALRGLAPPADFPAIRRITHTLIGFSQNVGALDLFKAAMALNGAAKAADAAGCAAGVEAVLKLHDAYKMEGECN